MTLTSENSEMTENCEKPMQLRGHEYRVLFLVAEGLTKPEIADALGISEHSVTRVFYSIAEATGTTNRIHWLNLFGKWQMHDDAKEVSETFRALPADFARRCRSGRKKISGCARRSAKAIIAQEPKREAPFCTFCGKVRTLQTVTTAGGLFEFPGCKVCQRRLNLVRVEAKARMAKRRNRDRDMIIALARAGRNGDRTE